MGLFFFFFSFVDKMVQPLVRRKIVKKKTNKFKRHQSDRFFTVKESWRKPKGIDNRMRRKFRGMTRMPKIGYGSNRRTRHVLQNGFKKFRVNNTADLEILLMHNRTYAAQIAHNVSSNKRKDIIQRADQLNIKVINRNGRLKQEESE